MLDHLIDPDVLKVSRCDADWEATDDEYSLWVATHNYECQVFNETDKKIRTTCRLN